MIFNCEKDAWENCYEEGWRKLIVPDAFCHPAKFSRGLIRRIYEHAIAENWIKKGDTVLDPFGGVALGALDAITNGLNWVGVELEEKFVELGEQNLLFWKERLNKQYTAKIIQGDSRRIKEYVKNDLDLVISSPPFMDNNVNIGAVGNTPAMRQQIHNSKKRSDSYGQTPGQLGNMQEGDITLVVSSPPYAESCGVGLAPTGTCFGDGASSKLQKESGRDASYGKTPGQLGNIPPSEIHSSTFWSVSREIIQGCYDLLKPEGHAIWVTKDYVKDGKRVPFSNNWITLCEAVGFKTVCWHHAMVVKQIPQHTFDESKVVKERKSFFRRLAESKGSPKIDWEDVICMVK